jgi:Predicted phosphatases
MKKYLICVDSDGCVMDTMNQKHREYFGPVFVEYYNLEEIKEEALDIWLSINLFSKTRGINRFLGLKKTLEELQKRGKLEREIEVELKDISNWLKNSKEYSNQALLQEYEKVQKKGLKRAYEWSIQVNERIYLQNQKSSAFLGVKKQLSEFKKNADIAIVSSANAEAVKKEWEEEGLLSYVNYIMTQEMGSKKEGIAKLLKLGYKKEHVLMIGDSLGDWQAAFDNKAAFYPILVGKETLSWEKIIEGALIPLMDNNFTKKYQEYLLQEYYKELDNENNR